MISRTQFFASSTLALCTGVFTGVDFIIIGNKLHHKIGLVKSGGRENRGCESRFILLAGFICIRAIPVAKPEIADEIADAFDPGALRPALLL
ncbi:hypothetical protein EON65_48745, partial [archaeon]